MSAVATRRNKSGNPWPAKLKALRQHYGLTQQQACEEITAPLSTWRGWEHGRRRPSPMIDKLLRLAFPAFFAKIDR
jgi:DNA-binding transcriptional regulator YiaG